MHQAASVTEYFTWYTGSVDQALKGVDTQAMERAFKLIADAKAQGKHIYSAGNGGSAAIADHLCCDFGRGSYTAGQPRLKTQSLTSNQAIFTATANDSGYERVFSEQLESLADRGDVLLVISGSGNSPNIVGALETAKRLGMKSIALTGFEGGAAGTAADVQVHVRAQNYGIAEDCHQIVMHVLAQYLFLASKRSAPNAR